MDCRVEKEQITPSFCRDSRVTRSFEIHRTKALGEGNANLIVGSPRKDANLDWMGVERTFSYIVTKGVGIVLLLHLGKKYLWGESR